MKHLKDSLENSMLPTPLMRHTDAESQDSKIFLSV